MLKKFIAAKDSSVSQENLKETKPNSEKVYSTELADKQKKLDNIPFNFDDGSIYTGRWLNDQRHGFGVNIWPEGSRYEGQWSNDKCHGRGNMIHSDGDVYSGDWIEDQAEGHGMYILVFWKLKYSL